MNRGIIMNILIAGAAGFIGTNLTLALMKNPANHITITDTDTSYFTNETIIAANNVSCLALHTQTHNFENILENIDLVFHLVSTTNPSSSNNSSCFPCSIIFPLFNTSI